MTAGMPTLRLKWPANAVVIKTRLSVPKYDIDSFFLPAKIQKKTNYNINYIWSLYPNCNLFSKILWKRIGG